MFAPLLGNGIFTQDGQLWAHSRALLKPAFRQQDQALSQVASATEQLLRLIPSSKIVDLQPLFFRFTLETTSYLLFGQQLGVLENQVSEDATSFATAFDIGQDYLARRGRLGGLYWLIDGSEFRTNCKRVHQHLDRAIVEALSKRNDSGSGYTILEALAQETNDIKDLREQCLNVLLAGRDTTACLLSWTL